jgi:polysaccharide biosynthesis/export protein
MPREFTMLCRSVFGSAATVVALLFLAAAAPAQNSHQTSVSSAGNGLHATRAELEGMLASSSGGINQTVLRTRLEEGDFQTGDQITLFVDTHPDLSGTYVVEPTRTIAIPGVGDIPLRGVLRSELQGHLTQHLGQFVRSPRVRAQSTIRIMVLGGVGQPGFYSVPSHALVTEVIDSAGGTGRESRLTNIRIERDGERVIAGRQLQDAIIAGRTLDQLGVRAGDRVVVPEARGPQIREYLGWIGAIGGVLWTFAWMTGRR